MKKYSTETATGQFKKGNNTRGQMVSNKKWNKNEIENLFEAFLNNH
jgi:hypothetical protein